MPLQAQNSRRVMLAVAWSSYLVIAWFYQPNLAQAIVVINTGKQTLSHAPILPQMQAHQFSFTTGPSGCSQHKSPDFGCALNV